MGENTTSRTSILRGNNTTLSIHVGLAQHPIKKGAEGTVSHSLVMRS